MKRTRLFSKAVLFLALWLPAGVKADAHAPVVIELFTSEGCSSCPPADKYLSEMADDKDLLPLSMHVDYWDYIGWKDPFASPRITQRQRSYQRRMGLRYVYTPQMVVQGQWEGVGSNRGKIRGLIKKAKKAHLETPPVPVALQLAAGDKKNLLVRIPKHRFSSRVSATLYLVVYERERVVKVKRGENRGRTLGHRNVVRSFTAVGKWTGDALETTLAIPDVPDVKGIVGEDVRGIEPPRSVAILVQDTRDRAILGAGSLSIN